MSTDKPRKSPVRRTFEQRVSELCSEANTLAGLAFQKGNEQLAGKLRHLSHAVVRELPESQWPVELVGNVPILGKKDPPDVKPTITIVHNNGGPAEPVQRGEGGPIPATAKDIQTDRYWDRDAKLEVQENAPSDLLAKGIVDRAKVG